MSWDISRSNICLHSAHSTLVLSYEMHSWRIIYKKVQTTRVIHSFPLEDRPSFRNRIESYPFIYNTHTHTHTHTSAPVIHSRHTHGWGHPPQICKYTQITTCVYSSYISESGIGPPTGGNSAQIRSRHMQCIDIPGYTPNTSHIQVIQSYVSCNKFQCILP